MSRLYDTVEPAVIDEEMLQKSVEEQGPKEEAGRVAKSEGIDFKDVKALRLDFKNILKIDNLWCFTSLTKLQIDNNIIEKIEGLDMLVNLVWLDLSFNNIEVIEGLDSLVNIEDLTLYNNRISEIEGLDALTKLQVFSIGNNELTDLENLIYLRRFKQLQTLNLSGNPVCELDDYKPFVIAHLPLIDYLDYRLIDEASKESAKEKYEIAVQEIEHDERVSRRKLEESQAKEREYELHKAMYDEDPEGQKLNLMPGVEEMRITYKDKFTASCVEIFNVGLKKRVEREGDLQMFWECIADAKNENRRQGTKIINDFMEYKAKVWADLSDMADQKQIELTVTDYNQQVTELRDQLMVLEMQLVDQLDESIKDFERNMADMVSTFTEIVQGHISTCRDLENMHHERLLELAVITLEKVVKSEMDEEIADELRELFVDKDTIVNAVTSSHDVHLLKIDNREDEIVTKSNQWLTNMMENIHNTEEVSRNRSRVSEINNVIDHLRDEVDNLDLDRANY